jgi:hypothetical protein
VASQLVLRVSGEAALENHSHTVGVLPLANKNGARAIIAAPFAPFDNLMEVLLRQFGTMVVKVLEKLCSMLLILLTAVRSGLERLQGTWIDTEKPGVCDAKAGSLEGVFGREEGVVVEMLGFRGDPHNLGRLTIDQVGIIKVDDVPPWSLLELRVW